MDQLAPSETVGCSFLKPQLFLLCPSPITVIVFIYLSAPLIHFFPLSWGLLISCSTSGRMPVIGSEKERKDNEEMDLAVSQLGTGFREYRMLID